MRVAASPGRPGTSSAHALGWLVDPIRWLVVIVSIIDHPLPTNHRQAPDTRSAADRRWPVRASNRQLADDTDDCWSAAVPKAH
jgi:hypothetical protein